MRHSLSLANRLALPLRPLRHTRPASRLYLATAALTLLTLLAVALVAAGPPQLPALDLPSEGATIAPDRPLLIGVPPLRLTLATATLWEVPLDAASAADAQPVPVKLSPLATPALWETARLQLVAPDGGSPLRPDASYRLTLAGNWEPFALPWLRTGPWSAEFHFSTLPSPKPLLSDQPLYPRYGQAITLQWDMPVVDFQYQVSPAVATSVARDPDDLSRAYLTLLDYVPGQTYQVAVTAANALNGIALQRPYSFPVVMPRPPTVALVSATTLRLGEPVALRWDQPIVDFEYRIEPAAPAIAAVDPVDRRNASITLQSIRQGQQYHITITAATAETGTRLEQPYSLTVRTPVALRVVERSPGNGAFGISPTRAIGLTFSEPVADREAVQRAFTLTPAVPGRFEWPSERELRFVPTAPFPFQTGVTVRLAAGPDAGRSRAGGYLESEISFKFTTRPNKLIDVDLSRQVVTLQEGGQVVLTSLTSTGVRGAETPTGTYMVQYKIPATRMRGVTPSGNRYDVPDVPWVLQFVGDYTIHGAYWRRGFGFPQSNGCVSLPVPVAKQIYDWAPLGTPVSIHY